MTEPLLRRLAARGERLTVGALPWVAPVYRAMPQVHRVIELPFRHGGVQLRERRLLARELQGQFATAYVLPNSIKSALLPFLASIPKRVGYLGEARVGLLTHRLRNPKNRPPMVAFYSALSGEPGIDEDRPRLQLQPQRITETTARYGLAPWRYMVFAPGAEYGPAKRWPENHYATLASLLSDQPAVLLGSAKEAALCDTIAAGASNAMNLAGKTSLEDAFALIAGARAVVSNDSGLMHVAAAFGMPQVALYGSSSPVHTPPLNDKAHVVWLKQDPHYTPPLDCSPCFERECPLGHRRCLVDIAPGVVAALPALRRVAPASA